LKENGQDFFSKYDSLSDCSKRCHERGFCMKKTCYCKPGYIGQDCGYDHYNWKKNNQNTNDAKRLMIIFGSISGGLWVDLVKSLCCAFC